MKEEKGWAEGELGKAKLGDKRLERRLVAMAEQRMSQPNGSLAESTGGGASLKAAYRFYDNEEIKPGAILASHAEATQERMRGCPVVLALQDTTQVDYSKHKATTGLGVLKDQNHHGLMVHSTMAVTPQRESLGLLAQEVWARPAEEFGKSAARRKRATDEKESQKWLTSLKAAAECQAQLPDTQVISVGDREADIYELFTTARELKVNVLVRAAQDRCIADESEQHLWAHVLAQEVAGTLSVEIPRQPGQPTRPAGLAVRFATLKLCVPQRKKKAFDVHRVEVSVVHVIEQCPPPATPDCDIIVRHH